MQILAVLLMGIIGDNYGLDKAYLFSALVSLLAIPIIFTLPKRENTGWEATPNLAQSEKSPSQTREGDF